MGTTAGLRRVVSPPTTTTTIGATSTSSLQSIDAKPVTKTTSTSSASSSKTITVQSFTGSNSSSNKVSGGGDGRGTSGKHIDLRFIDMDSDDSASRSKPITTQRKVEPIYLNDSPSLPSPPRTSVLKSASDMLKYNEGKLRNSVVDLFDPMEVDETPTTTRVAPRQNSNLHRHPTATTTTTKTVNPTPLPNPNTNPNPPNLADTFLHHTPTPNANLYPNPNMNRDPLPPALAPVAAAPTTTPSVTALVPMAPLGPFLANSDKPREEQKYASSDEEDAEDEDDEDDDQDNVDAETRAVPIRDGENTNYPGMEQDVQNLKSLLPDIDMTYAKKLLAKYSDARVEAAADDALENGYVKVHEPQRQQNNNASISSDIAIVEPPEKSFNQDEFFAQVTELIPDVNPDFLKRKIDQVYRTDVPQVSLVSSMVNELYENGYDKVVKKPKLSNIKPPTSKQHTNIETEIFGSCIDIQLTTTERELVVRMLEQTFRDVTTTEIRRIVSMYNGTFLASALYIHKALNGEGPPDVKITLLKNTRSGNTNIFKRLTPQLVYDHEQWLKYKAGLLLPTPPPPPLVSEANSPEDEMECACCYIEVPFSKMVQCLEGDLFCHNCLKSYIEASLFGGSRLTLKCMATGCESTFPRSQLNAALPENLLEQVDKRLQEVALLSANLENLVKCPFCDYQEIIENEDDKIFHCKNPECEKESCRLCGLESHIPLRCKEVEQPKATKARLSIEERMSQAKIRHCYKCKTSYVKETGCNKITCPKCHAIMCYVCRSPIDVKVGYQHFCQHPTNPGQSCDKCKKCRLYTKTEEDDELAIQEARRQAEEEMAEDEEVKEALKSRTIGPALSTAPAAPAHGIPGAPGLVLPPYHAVIPNFGMVNFPDVDNVNNPLFLIGAAPNNPLRHHGGHHRRRRH